MYHLQVITLTKTLTNTQLYNHECIRPSCHNNYSDIKPTLMHILLSFTRILITEKEGSYFVLFFCEN